MPIYAAVLGLVALGWGQGAGPGAAPPPASSQVADAITLRDGKVILGQVVEPNDRRGPLPVLVRRAWAESNLPQQLAAWEKAEAPVTRRAEAQRRERLAAWRREITPAVDHKRAIIPWLDAEIARLAPAPVVRPQAADEPAKSPLMLVKLPRNSIKAVAAKSRANGRLLRLAWSMGFPDPEAATLDDLKRGLEDRGFAASSDAPVAVDALLPTPLESDAEWLVRRAATEVARLPGGRFLLYGGAVLPEPAAGKAPPVGAAMEALSSTLKDLLGEEKANPLPGKLRELAGQGRVGAVVTSLEMAPDMASTTVATTLWVAPGGNRDWVAAVQRSSTVRPGDLPNDAGAGLAEDPQVKAALNIVGQLGLGEVPAELKQRSLNMGFATQKALGEARAALAQALDRLALPVEAPRPASAVPAKP